MDLALTGARTSSCSQPEEAAPIDHWSLTVVLPAAPQFRLIVDPTRLSLRTNRYCTAQAMLTWMVPLKVITAGHRAVQSPLAFVVGETIFRTADMTGGDAEAGLAVCSLSGLFVWADAAATEAISKRMRADAVFLGMGYSSSKYPSPFRPVSKIYP